MKHIRTLALEFTLFFALKFIHLLSLQSFVFFPIWDAQTVTAKNIRITYRLIFCIELKIDCTRANGLNCWKIYYNETQCLCLVIICISYTHAWALTFFFSSKRFAINRTLELKWIFFLFFHIEFEQCHRSFI